MNTKIRIFIVAILIGFTGHVFAGDEIFDLPVNKNEIKIMSYNVENLFDAIHDTNKNDYEFLPKNNPEKIHCDKNKRNSRYCRNLDWTKKKITIKINKIKEAIEAQGVLPDVLGLVEVENPRIIQQLAKALGYTKYVMTNSPDERGIDCAILYKSEKLKLVEFLERQVEKAYYPTRNLSFAIFQPIKGIGQDYIGVSMNHWPSQGGPTPVRLVVAEDFVQFAKLVSKKYEKQNIQMVVMGDFNTLENESPNPIEDVLLSKENGLNLLDVQELAVIENSPFLDQMPSSTYYYGVKNEWNRFDRMYVTNNLTDGRVLEVASETFRIHAPTFMTNVRPNQERVPMRYNHSTNDPNLAGYSDHFGIVVKLRYKN